MQKDSTNIVQTVSNLHKQNFDLKLELFHRRQKQSDLEVRLEEAEARLTDQAEMQAINEQLLIELEKRDQAVEEAVGIICNLEEKIERLLEERSTIRSFYAQNELDFRRSDDAQSIQDPVSSSPQLINEVHETPPKPTRSGLAPRSVPKMPSFLSERSEGTEALRSLYLPSDYSQSLLKPQGENTANEPSEGGMNSPRLSVLSESSFLSVYGEKSLAIEGLDLHPGVEAEPSRTHRNRRSNSVEQWVEERRILVSSPRLPLSRAGIMHEKKFISLDDVLESPLQRLEKLHRTLKSRKQLISAHVSTTTEHRSTGGKSAKEKPRDKIKTTESVTYERQQGLPPTPDTISTSTLRHYQVSNDTLSRDITERERERQLDRRFSLTYAPDGCIRPLRTGETVTSRRDGHGWDTVTQSEVTEVGSDIDVEAPTSIDPWIAMARERSRPKIQPPDMFTFSADDDEEWGRDMEFNPDSEPQYPLQNHLGQDDGVEEDPCDGRSISYQQSNSAYEQSQHDHQHQTLGSGLDSKQSPKPPERRSSLAISPGLNERKSRKRVPSVTTSATHHPRGATGRTRHQAQNGNKLSGITKLFGLSRSDASNSSSPATTPKAASASLARSSKSGGYVADLALKDFHRASATPPPISRYRRGSSENNGGRANQRPTTASSVGSRLPVRRSSVDANDREFYGFGFGADGAGDERDGGGRSGKEFGTGIGRKWFTMRRNGSLRR